MKEHQAGPQSHTLTNRDGGQQLKHTRLATGGEREEENRQAVQKGQHQKCSLGIKLKFLRRLEDPKVARKSRNWGKNRHNCSTCARLAEDSAQELSKRPLTTQP